MMVGYPSRYGTGNYEFGIEKKFCVGFKMPNLQGEPGRLIGVGDFRPTFGRFAVTNFNVLTE